MKDIFFTILIVWVLFRILSRGKGFVNNFSGNNNENKKGEISIDQISNKQDKKKKKNDVDDGDYVDYEEIK